METFQQAMLALIYWSSFLCELNIHYKNIQSYLFLYSKVAHAIAMTTRPKVTYLTY